MATAIHVNGPAVISLGAGGTGGGLSTLGISEDGVDIEFTWHDDDVIADSGGPVVPVDVQDMGKLAYITAKLVVYDQTVLETLFLRGAADGEQEPSPGKLLVANSLMKRVVISSPDEGLAYRFLYSHLIGSTQFRRGSKRTLPLLKWRALPGTGTTATMATLPLYDNTAA